MVVCKSAAIAAYRKMLEGTPLEDLGVSEEIKESIVLFEKYQSLPVFQIALKTGVPSDVFFELRSVKKALRRRELNAKTNNASGVRYVLRQHVLFGLSYTEMKKTGVPVDNIKQAKAILKMAKSGANNAEMAKKFNLRPKVVDYLLNGIEIKKKELAV